MYISIECIKSSILVIRFAAVGVNSFNSDPDVFAKITAEVKSWIQSVAEGTEDSDC